MAGTHQVATSFPDSSYSVGNKPSVVTLQGDITLLEDAHNSLDAEAVTLTGSETLTNKTLDSASLNNPTITDPTFNWDGWTSLPTLAWVSTDGSTNVFNATGDLTTVLSPGMRVKTQQDEALTAYWTFDAGSTSQVGSFDGTDSNMSYTAGKFGNAATFNGTTSKIVIADNASLKPTGEFTIGCWFKTANTGVYKGVFQSQSTNTNRAGIQLRIKDTNNFEFTTGKNTGATPADYSSLSGTSTVTDGNYHYVVASFRNNYGQLYIDGKLESSGYMFTPAYAATNYVRVGCQNDTGTDAFFMNGQIDDLFLINGYALDEKTIKAKYDAQTAQGTGNITVDKYALVTAVGAYSGGNTPITIWGGTDYSLQNATISNPYYSTVAQPFGFDKNPAKWTVEISDSIVRSQLSPVQNTWYNLGSITITVPIGMWDLCYFAALNGTSNASQVNTICLATLSTANNTESDLDMTSVTYSQGASSTIISLNSLYRNKKYKFLSKTSLYLNEKTTLTNNASINLSGDASKTIIRAVSTYI